LVDSVSALACLFAAVKPTNTAAKGEIRAPKARKKS
jgi:hypothetical protein